MGSKLGTIFAQAGHDVVFSYSRSDKKLQKLADGAGRRAKAGTPAEAASNADAVLLAVHWTRVDDALAQAGKLSGKTVLTCSLPMSKDDSRMVIGFSTSGAEALAARIPRAHVISAFSTAPSEALLPVFKRQKGNAARPRLLRRQHASEKSVGGINSRCRLPPPLIWAACPWRATWSRFRCWSRSWRTTARPVPS
jgi:hypothetical protein